MINTDNVRHAEKMAKKKVARDRMLASKTEKKGLLIVHTGKGKGKSTAAWGMALRMIGHGKRVGIVQFVKGAWETGERDVFDKFPDQVTIKAMGEGFTWETQDRMRDVAAASIAWAAAKAMIDDETYSMIILDEINIALRYEYLNIGDVLEGLAARPNMLHVIATGRNAHDDMIETADLVTDMSLVKHPFRSGIKAQQGVEF
jgi:cob(I)alamin adenosyltransferase